MSGDIRTDYFLRVNIVKSEATSINSSSGNITDRAHLSLFSNSRVESAIAKIAIKTLSPQESDISRRYSPNWFQSWFWQPITVRNEATGQLQRVLVNIQSFKKRMGHLGYTSREINEALKLDRVGEMMINHKTEKLYYFASYLSQKYPDVKTDLKNAIKFINANQSKWQKEGIECTHNIGPLSILYKKDGSIIINCYEMLLDFTSEQPYLKKIAPQLANFEIREISTFILLTKSKLSQKLATGKERLIAERRASSSEPIDESKIFTTMYIKPNQAQRYVKSLHLPRALTFNSKGQIFIHFNRKKNGDKLVGQGSNKIVCEAFEYTQAQKYASVAELYPEYSSETNHLIEFAGKKGFAQLHDMAMYQVEDKEDPGFMIDKNRYIMTRYDGDLFSVIDKVKPENQIIIARSLIDAVAHLHSEDNIHKDIKPENILVSQTDEGYDAVLSDFGTLAHVTDLAKHFDLRGTTIYTAPECLKEGESIEPPAGMQHHRDAIETARKMRLSYATTKKNDVWSLGLVLYQMVYRKKSLPWRTNPWLETPNEILKKMKKLSKNKNGSFFTEPSNPNSLEHLAWEMLQMDPAKRITIEEAQRRLNSITLPSDTRETS